MLKYLYMFIAELRKNFQGEIYEDTETRAKASHDASIFEVMPSAVVAPRSTVDVQLLVKTAVAAREQGEHVSLTPRSAGTCMSGGSLTESVVLTMTPHFNQIHEVEIAADKKSGYAITDPGVFYRDLDKETKRRNLFMPAYPASREIASVGGMVGNNSGGEKTLAYGKIENYILELQVVLADGNEYTIKPLTKEELEMKIKLPTFEGRLYKQLYALITAHQEVLAAAKPAVSKNSAGYYLWNVWDPSANSGQGVFDLTRLIVGSQGTLGIVTRIKFRLVPVKPISKMLVLFLKERQMPQLGDIVVALKAQNPETIEAYDDHTLKLAMRFFPDLLKILKPKNILSMFWHLLPEIWIFITGGIPKMVIMAEFTGEKDADVDAQIHAAAAAMQRFGARQRITASEEEEREFWIIRRESFNLLRNKVKDKHTAPFIDDFAVKPEVLPEFLPKLQAILGAYDLTYTIAGHPGDGNFHIIPLMNLEDQVQRAIIPKLSDEVYTLVLQYKGTITAEHNDGLIRTPYLERMYGTEITTLFAQVKKMFDPSGIFNPGKKVGGDLGYSLAHIRRKF